MAALTRESNHLSARACLSESARSQATHRQIRGMILMMTDAPVMSIDKLKAFLSSSDVLTFKGNSRKETYGWIERVLRTYSYSSRPRSEKGLIRSYMQKMIGNSIDTKPIPGCCLRN